MQLQIADKVRIDVSRAAISGYQGQEPGRRLKASHEQEPAYRVITILVVVALAVWAFYPPGEKINLGLDLKGGVHLVLRVQTDDALKLETETTVERLRDTLTRAGVAFTKLEADERAPSSSSRASRTTRRSGRRPSSPTPCSTAAPAPAATPTR